jgi:hypothetical protein
VSKKETGKKPLSPYPPVAFVRYDGPELNGLAIAANINSSGQFDSNRCRQFILLGWYDKDKRIVTAGFVFESDGKFDFFEIVNIKLDILETLSTL